MNGDTDRLDPDFDSRIADWLETDPERAPGEVIDTILAALPSVPQRRSVLSLPWTFPPVLMTARLALTAVAIVAVAVSFVRAPAVGPAASPSLTTSPSPVAPPPALTERFDSVLNAISMSYPTGWRTKRAAEPWDRGALGFAASDVDVIFDPTLGDAVYIAIVSEPLDGQRPEDWSDSVVYPDICEPGSGGHGGGTSTLDGAKAFFVTSGCIRHGRPGDRHSIVAATKTRGYIIALYVLDARLGTIYDLDWFTSVLETVQLHPESAR